jgi:hypothetical protein
VSCSGLDAYPRASRSRNTPIAFAIAGCVIPLSRKAIFSRCPEEFALVAILEYSKFTSRASAYDEFFARAILDIGRRLARVVLDNVLGEGTA